MVGRVVREAGRKWGEVGEGRVRFQELGGQDGT